MEEILVLNKLNNMNKKTKTIIGVAAVGVVAYFVLKPKGYANANAKSTNFWNREAHLKFWKKIFG